MADSLETGDAAAAAGTTRGLAIPWPSRQFVTYLFVGALNTVFGYGLFTAFVLAGLHYALAAALATVLGVLFNFQTTGRIVFGSRDRALVFRFVAVYALTYVLNVGILRALEGTHVHVLVVQAALVLPMAALSFALHRRFVFRRTAESP